MAEMMAEAGINRRLVRMGLNDTYIHGASKSYLMREYGLDALALVRKIEQLLGVTLNITEADLTAVPLTVSGGQLETRLEAL
jgi:transketolase